MWLKVKLRESQLDKLSPGQKFLKVRWETHPPPLPENPWIDLQAINPKDCQGCLQETLGDFQGFSLFQVIMANPEVVLHTHDGSMGRTVYLPIHEWYGICRHHTWMVGDVLQLSKATVIFLLRRDGNFFEISLPGVVVAKVFSGSLPLRE